MGRTSSGLRNKTRRSRGEGERGKGERGNDRCGGMIVLAESGRNTRIRTQGAGPCQTRMHWPHIIQALADRPQRRNGRAHNLPLRVVSALDIVAVAAVDQGRKHVGPALLATRLISLRETSRAMVKNGGGVSHSLTVKSSNSAFCNSINPSTSPSPGGPNVRPLLSAGPINSLSPSGSFPGTSVLYRSIDTPSLNDHPRLSNHSLARSNSGPSGTPGKIRGKIEPSWSWLDRAGGVESVSDRATRSVRWESAV